MDRLIVQPAAIPLDTDILSIQRNAMIALGYLAQAALGTGTIVDGLACTPTSPASMVVNVGQGSIFTLFEIDATAFGSLPLDTDPLVKFGINAVGVTPFTLTAPSTSGQSINYLIEAAFQEADGTPVVLPYYNPANPAAPYSGPSNDGVAQNTVRKESVQLQLKAGAAATTGTQTTPAVDAGWVGLYVVTVNYGMTTVVSGDIAVASGAPFLPQKLPQTANVNGSATEAFAMTTAAVGTNTTQGASTAFVYAMPHGSSVLASSGTFTVPAGVYNLKLIRGWSGGGGGAGGTNSGPAGGGGASASRFDVENVAVTPGQSITVVVGAAGAAGSAASDGGTGGNTTVTVVATTYTAAGGTGGNATGTSAQGGVASGGTLNLGARDGKCGSGTGAKGGDGGDAPGAGGGGGGGGSGYVGGDGGAGEVLFRW